MQIGNKCYKIEIRIVLLKLTSVQGLIFEPGGNSKFGIFSKVIVWLSVYNIVTKKTTKFQHCADFFFLEEHNMHYAQTGLVLNTTDHLC